MRPSLQYTVLELASMCGRPQAVKALLDLGADVDLRLPHAAYTVLHSAVMRAATHLRKSSMSMHATEVTRMRSLLARGADPNLSPPPGHVNATNQSSQPLGCTAPLHAAASGGNVLMVVMFAAAGADPALAPLPPECMTQVRAAVHTRQLAAVQRLLKQEGACIDAIDANRVTPMVHACMQ